MLLQRNKTLLVALTLLLGLLALSAYKAADMVTWLMEVMPIFIALPIMLTTYKRFPLTNVLYVCIFLHAAVLMVGGHYTYAHVPFGFQIQEWFDLHRNPYDKIGHFFQSFVPALVAREVLIRGKYVSGRGMLAFIVVCIVLAISATYELIEWGAAMAMGQGADEFLGTQGDQWDTQSDMLFALIGSIAALLLLSRWHDRQIKNINTTKN